MAVIYKFGDYEFPSNSARGKDEAFNYREALQDMPTADGAWDHLGDDNYKDSALVEHRFWLEADSPTDLETAIDDFREAMHAGRQALYWRMEDGSVRWAWAKCVDIAMPTSRETREALPVAVTFRVPEAYRYDLHAASGALWGSFDWGDGTLWGGSVTTSFAFSNTVTDITVTNVGNAPALVVVTISCSAVQTANNVKVARRVSGVDVQYFQSTRAISSSKALVVDCEDQSVEYDGSDDYSAFTIGSDQVEWLHLEPGDNSIRISCSSPSDAGTIEFDFYPTFH